MDFYSSFYTRVWRRSWKTRIKVPLYRHACYGGKEIIPIRTGLRIVISLSAKRTSFGHVWLHLSRKKYVFWSKDIICALKYFFRPKILLFWPKYLFPSVRNPKEKIASKRAKPKIIMLDFLKFLSRIWDPNHARPKDPNRTLWILKIPKRSGPLAHLY